MKILLVCAGGLSSSIVMKKVRRYGEEIGEDIQIDAVGVPAVEDTASQGYDCVLTAPQVRNRFQDIQRVCSIPVASMAPQDYAIGNAKNIVQLARQLVDTKKEDSK